MGADNKIMINKFMIKEVGQYDQAGWKGINESKVRDKDNQINQINHKQINDK